MELSPTEIKKANSLKSEFSKVRSQIEEVEKKMESLNFEAGTLIKKLESLRDEEKNLMDFLHEKYGPGTLDPIKLIYHVKQD
jgi:hypothetical protein